MKQFHTAARRGTSSLPNDTDVQFEFEVVDGEFVTMTAHPPTTGQMALFLTRQTNPTETVRSLFAFLGRVLDPADYRLIENKLAEGVDVQIMVEIVEFLIEEWTGRPIRPPSVSPSSPNGNGKPSTGKRHSKASTSSS